MFLMRLCPCIFAFPVTSLTLALHSKFVCDVVEGDIDSNTSPTFSTAEEDLATESPWTCSTSKAKESIKKSFNEAAKKATERALNNSHQPRVGNGLEPLQNVNYMAKTGKKRTQRPCRKRWQRGGKFDLQKAIEKTGIEFHLPGMNFTGPGTKLQKRLKRGARGVNRLDEIAKIHDIDYSKVNNLQDKWKADDKMIRAITMLPGKKTKTEWVVKKIMQAKRKLKL